MTIPAFGGGYTSPVRAEGLTKFQMARATLSGPGGSLLKAIRVLLGKTTEDVIAVVQEKINADYATVIESTIDGICNTVRERRYFAVGELRCAALLDVNDAIMAFCRKLGADDTRMMMVGVYGGDFSYAATDVVEQLMATSGFREKAREIEAAATRADWDSFDRGREIDAAMQQIADAAANWNMADAGALIDECERTFGALELGEREDIIAAIGAAKEISRQGAAKTTDSIGVQLSPKGFAVVRAAAEKYGCEVQIAMAIGYGSGACAGRQNIFIQTNTPAVAAEPPGAGSEFHNTW
ncbi:MAG: hypothetical protein LBB38_02395 [Puniceicoccales bacterium]|jgi:hypothetical protein|nr:hypothetical protein [Puniceicoccales bacterium]